VTGRPLRTAGLALFCLALLLCAACGKKGPVRPLLKPLPEAPAAEARQQGGAVLLSWTIPTSNQDGTPLTDLQGFIVYRMDYDPEEGCPDCREPSAVLREIDLDYLQGAVRIENRLIMRDSETEVGRGYRYRVVPLTTGGLSGAGTSLSLPLSAPPLPPENLQAEGHDRLIRLTWSPAGPEATYNLYRQAAGEPTPMTPLNRQALTEPSYDDFAVENDKTYVYSVRTVDRVAGHPVESDPSPPLETVPVPGR